jgi:hypothetical protein
MKINTNPSEGFRSFWKKRKKDVSRQGLINKISLLKLFGIIAKQKPPSIAGIKG